MASETLSEEQTDLLLNIKEDASLEADDLESAAPNNSINNNNNDSKPVAGKSGKFKSRIWLCTRQICRVLPTRHRCWLHVTSFLQIFLALVMMVTLPCYLEISSFHGSDNFGSLFFLVSLTTTSLILLMGLRKFWDPSFSLYSKLVVQSILRDSFVCAISLLGIFYCRELDHVPCHLQDGLFFLCIPFAIFYMSIKKRREKVNKNVKLIGMLTAFMALVFISTVPQLAYRFGCRGNELELTKELQEELTIGKGPALWILAYVVFIGLLTCSFCGFWSCMQEHEDSGSRSLEWTTWFHVFASAALVCLFWTDILPAIGGAEGLGDFVNKLSGVWSCHFSSICPTTSKLGFVLPACWLLFMYTCNLLVYRYQSNPVYVICNASLAVPLLSLVYNLFQFIQPDGIPKPSLSLGSLICMVTLPIAYTLLGSYHSATVVLNLLDSFDIY